MSKVQAFYHIVFCTKGRESTIPEQFKEDLYRYIWKEIVSSKCKLLRIGGIANHIHILLELNPMVALSPLIQNIKSRSSGWMKSDSRFNQFKGWGTGYFAATIGTEAKSSVIQYIKSQHEHHKTVDLDQEFRKIYAYSGFDYDENELT